MRDGHGDLRLDHVYFEDDATAPTILDLVVVFLFRHPIMTLFANTKAFMSPRVSGLGRAMRRTPTEEPAQPRTSRVKEA